MRRKRWWRRSKVLSRRVHAAIPRVDAGAKLNSTNQHIQSHMSILINKSTRVICQGITGKAGAFHTKGCKEYGTNMVGGVTPGKAGETVEGVPVFDTVSEAVEKTGANATM